MAAAREVPWLEIRRLWESTSIGDAELAAQFGFGSKTTIARRRATEGWRRDVQAATAEVVSRAVLGDVPGGHTADTPRTHGHIEQNQSVVVGPAAGVSGQTGVDTSLSQAMDTFAGARVALADPVEDWFAIKAAAKRRHLARTLEMQDTCMRALRAVTSVMEGPMVGGPADYDEETGEPIDRTPYGLAIISLRAVNADRETMAGLMKAAIDGMDKAVKLERMVLGIGKDEAADSGGPGSGLPAGMMSEETLVSMYGDNLAALEALADTAREIKRTGGRIIDVTAEP